MEMDGMSSSVMGLRFCATQLPWPLTLVIPILPSSIFHLPFRKYPSLLSYNPDTSASQPVLPSPFSFSSPHLPPPFPPLPSICLFSFCPARPSSRRCACICVDLVVGGWGFVSGFVQLGGGEMGEERRWKGGGGDEMRDYCEVGFFAGRFGGIF